jgi:glutamate racemase
VVRAIRTLLPDLDILYVADSAHAPYGSKPPEYVRQRASHITQFLLEQGATAIVVACNTATAMAVEQLREQFEVPIIAMEPAVKPAVAATRSGVIGVLATAGTLESARYRRLLALHGSQVQVLGRVCHHWVELVESGCLDSEGARNLVAAEVLPLLQAGADTLVLGCTHFPFLAKLIREVAGAEVALVDPAPAVASHLANKLGPQRGGNGTTQLWSSREDADESDRLSELLGISAKVQALP